MKIFDDLVLHQLHQQVCAQIGELPLIEQQPAQLYFSSLAESIIGQQLSNKVADTIIERARKAAGSEFTPEAVRKVEIETFRQAGLSYAKANYLHNLAVAWEEGLVSPEKYTQLSDEEIIADLLKIKGIGRWTAEMFLIFTMGRTDVFSVGDYALRKAVLLQYQLPPETKPTEILKITARWSPHRSLASRLLWKSLDVLTKKP